MKRLKSFLWVIVFLYIAYAIYQDGPTPLMLGLLALAIIVLLMQGWMKSNLRKRLREKNK